MGWRIGLVGVVVSAVNTTESYLVGFVEIEDTKEGVGKLSFMSC